MSDSENRVVHTRALVHLHSTEEGGRKTSIGKKYMPHLQIGGIDGYARFLLGEGVTMAPGVEMLIDLAIVGSPAFIAELRPGQSFAVHEGSREVGRGVIESILRGSI